MLADTAEGLLLVTVHVYSPGSPIFREWVYSAVTGSFNTVWVPWVTVVESLVQVTVVAGPPVEIQVRVCVLESYVTPPAIVISPKTQVWHVIPIYYMQSLHNKLLFFSMSNQVKDTHRLSGNIIIQLRLFAFSSQEYLADNTPPMPVYSPT